MARRSSAVSTETEVVYGHVESAEDIRKINRLIRNDMEQARTREQLTELKRRIDYLCTLAIAPAWKRKFGDKVDEILRVAKEENRKTLEFANEIARRQGWEVDYDPWGE